METKRQLSPEVVNRLREELPRVADEVVDAIMASVPVYANPFQGRMGETIRTAVQVALAGFIDTVARGGLGDPDQIQGGRVQDVYDAAYQLGRGEARSGRSMDALASAYRVGARKSWRSLSTAATEAGMEAAEVARLAEMVFNYIDELSDMSVRGHVEELAASGRARQRRLEQLFAQLVAGAAEPALADAAERAEWSPPKTLTAVILRENDAATIAAALDDRTLMAGDTPGLEGPYTALLVPDAGRSRTALLRLLRGVSAIVGPTRPWTAARASYERALHAYRLGLEGDTETHLVDLILQADPAALTDLRTRALAPLNRLTPTARDKLTETLRAWLLHHGRREDIAAALFVHPQTVRYRMGQLRELYGDKLTDPHTILELTVALGAGSGT